MQMHYTNETDGPRYVGGILVPAGATRLVPADAIIVQPAAVSPPTDQANPLAVLVAGKVTEIIAALPGLSEDQVETLLQLERDKGDKARKTLIEAMELRKLEALDMRIQAERDAAAAQAAAQGDGAPGADGAAGTDDSTGAAE